MSHSLVTDLHLCCHHSEAPTVMSIDLPLFPLTPYLAYPISTAQIAYLGRLTVAVAVEAGEMRTPYLMRQSQSGIAFAFIVVIGIKAAFPASLETSRISK
jgi:hypothetical protein